MARRPALLGAVVLVVEDHELHLKLFAELLHIGGARTVGARTARGGIRLARHLRPDLVLMDLRLPDMQGDEALAQLRADATTQDLKVIAVTAAAMVGDRERLLSAGFDGYVAKPIDTRRFVDDLAALLEPVRLEGRGCSTGPC